MSDNASGTPEELLLVGLASTTGLPASIDWDLDLSGLFPDAALPLAARLDMGGFVSDGAGGLTGRLRVAVTRVSEFADLKDSPILFAGDGETSPGAAHFSDLLWDGQTLSAQAGGLGGLLSKALPFGLNGAPVDLAIVPDGDGFAASLASLAKNPGFDLVPALVHLTFGDDANPKNLGMLLSTRDGLGLSLPEGISDLAGMLPKLGADFFGDLSDQGQDKLLSHVYEAVPGLSDAVGKLFELKAGAAAILEEGAKLIGWAGRRPRVSAGLLAAFDQVGANLNRRLRSFAGSVLGDAMPCLVSFADPKFVDARPTFAPDEETGRWRLRVPLALTLDDEAKNGEVFQVEGVFSFLVGLEDDADGFLSFGVGSMAVDPVVVLRMGSDDYEKGRSFGGLVSLHIPKGSAFVFNTDPIDPSVRWDRLLSQQATDPPIAATSRNILVRVPASKGATPMDKPEGKRFSFEIEEFALTGRGLDLKGVVRVEDVSLNLDDDDDADDDNKHATTGFRAPLSVQKPEPSRDGDGEQAPVGTLAFRNSKLVHGSLRAGFRLRWFDDATGVIGFTMAEDAANKKLTVVGEVEIDKRVEYRVDALYSTFQINRLKLATRYERESTGKIKWSSDGSISGAVKFQTGAGQSASGPVADLFSGVTCEFEDLNPVRLGHDTKFRFTFPPKTFKLAEVMEVDLRGIEVGATGSSVAKHFGLLGEVRIKDLPGVDASLTFGGISLETRAGSLLPEVTIEEIGGRLAVPGGFEVEAAFRYFKDDREQRLRRQDAAEIRRAARSHRPDQNHRSPHRRGGRAGGGALP